MWPDNETGRDFLNFTGIASTVAEMICQADGRPISIGVSGAWGVGKSSMLRLVRSALETRSPGFIFVDFNAWLYQGYDDARAALVEVIATALEQEAEKSQTGLDKVKQLFKRVNWLRVGRLAATTALPLAVGMAPLGLIGALYQMSRSYHGKEAQHEVTAAMTEDVLGRLEKTASGLLSPAEDSSPPKEIHAIRTCFEDALSAMGRKLVVLIDDLDRCLPVTTIATLEAIRLFLFLKNTAFVIAADDTMIKHAVRSHFHGIDDTSVISYFDKLIQVPIRVPPLGTQEVRAYMMLLFVDNSDLTGAEKESIREKVCEQLGRTWRGARVDRAFMQTTHDNFSSDLVARFDTADRLAPLMTRASHVSGNPRLIKRFLNALSIRMTISATHGVSVDEAILAKMLLFERCALPGAYEVLTNAVNHSEEGKPLFLDEWEEKALSGDAPELDEPWNDPFVVEWLRIPPRLANTDLRGVLYVGREHAPVITPEDRLSSEAAELLAAVLEYPKEASALVARLSRLPRPEIMVILDRLLERARQVQEWGTPDILDACLAVCDADSSQGPRLAAFLKNRPSAQVRPSIVPKIGDRPWTTDVFSAWRSAGVASSVTRAISREMKDYGNV